MVIASQQHNDGVGFGSTFKSDRITKLNGTPNISGSVSGEDLNPGSLGNFLGATYSTSTYEVNGILYHIYCYSSQQPPNWVFNHSGILKSTDSGANWVNNVGQTNVLPANNDSSSMFPNDNMREMSFVKYGQGGVAPNVDNAQTYVYLYSPSASFGNDFYLCRISRSDLPSLDKTKIQYYKGGDGMNSANWSTNTADALSIYNDSNPSKTGPGSMIYNAGLGRYILTYGGGDCWASPQTESIVHIAEAEHTWGPWTKVLSDDLNNREKKILTWFMAMPKFTSDDGKKMWITTSGETKTKSPWNSNQYKLQFKAMYLTNNTVQTYEAESASLTGTTTATTKAGYQSSGYVTSFDTINDKCQFNINVSTSGAYILKFRYNTQSNQQISCYVNGTHKEDLLRGKTENDYMTWCDYTMYTWLTSGNNTVALQYDSGDSGSLNLDNLKLALYSTVGDSLPGCYDPLSTPTPTPTPEQSVTVVNDSTLSYGSGWTYDNSGSRALDYSGDIHWCSVNNSYMQYTFNGTGVEYINDKANDLGDVDIYIDNMTTPLATESCYNASRLYQQVIYSKTDLAAGTHTIKIVKKNGNYSSIDALRLFDGATPTPPELVSFATSKILGGTLRNNYSDYLGMKLTIGSSNITVKELGRYFILGNSGTHTLKITRASDDADLGSVSINMSSGTTDSLGFKYATLSTPVTLLANSVYYISSLEINGGDQWNNDVGTTLTTTNAATINVSVWHGGSVWNTANSGTTYIPLNFKY